MARKRRFRTALSRHANMLIQGQFLKVLRREIRSVFHPVEVLETTLHSGCGFRQIPAGSLALIPSVSTAIGMLSSLGSSSLGSSWVLRGCCPLAGFQLRASLTTAGAETTRQSLDNPAPARPILQRHQPRIPRDQYRSADCQSPAAISPSPVLPSSLSPASRNVSLQKICLALWIPNHSGNDGSCLNWPYTMSLWWNQFG